MAEWLEHLTRFAGWQNTVNKFTYEAFFLPLIAIFLLLEILVSGWRESSLHSIWSLRRSDRWDLFSVAITFLGIRKVLGNLAFFGLVAFIQTRTGNYSLNLLSDEPPWLRVCAAFLVYDFLMYACHRARHEIGWLWVTHEFHHASTRVSIWTNYRVHPLDHLFLFLGVLLPFRLLFGASVSELFALTILLSLPGFSSHARADTGFGWLGRYLFVSPRFHHLHHSMENEKTKNYGHALVIWDRLFGTYAAPERSIHQIPQGIEDNFYETESYVRAYLRPLRNFYAYPLIRKRR